MIKVELKAIDIKTGDWCNSGNCPLAKAIRRTFKSLGLKIDIFSGHSAIAVWGENFDYYQTGDRLWIPSFLTIDLPSSASRFRKAFDSGRKPKKEFKPFNFCLNGIKIREVDGQNYLFTDKQYNGIDWKAFDAQVKKNEAEKNSIADKPKVKCSRT